MSSGPAPLIAGSLNVVGSKLSVSVTWPPVIAPQVVVYWYPAGGGGDEPWQSTVKFTVLLPPAVNPEYVPVVGFAVHPDGSVPSVTFPDPAPVPLPTATPDAV